MFVVAIKGRNEFYSRKDGELAPSVTVSPNQKEGHRREDKQLYGIRGRKGCHRASTVENLKGEGGHLKPRVRYSWQGVANFCLQDVPPKF